MIHLKNKKTKTQPVKTFDPSEYTPILRCSICTGEQTAGFLEKATGKFHEIMLIRNDRDLEEFKAVYGVEELQKQY